MRRQEDWAVHFRENLALYEADIEFVASEPGVRLEKRMKAAVTLSFAEHQLDPLVAQTGILPGRVTPAVSGKNAAEGFFSLI